MSERKRERQLAAGGPPAAGGGVREPQSTAVEIHFGERSRLAARVDVTPVGLLAIGGMVSMILLSSAAIVRAARARRA